MRKPILILYQAGAYGTFIEWLLTYLTDQTLDDQLPFGQRGNAHKFRGNNWNIFPNLKFPLDPNNCFVDFQYSGFSRAHPGRLTAEQEKSFFSSTLIIKVPPTSILWILRNQNEKLNFSEIHKLYSEEELLKLHNASDGNGKDFVWLDNIKKSLDHNIFKQYNVNNVEDLERWQLREIFSYWNIHKTIGDHPDSAHTNNYHITVEDLRDQMPTVINKIIQKLKLNVVLDRHKKLDYIWQEWKSKQEYVNMDSIVDNYVKNVISGIDQTVPFSFNICEEVVIQQKLREAGYEIKCDGLDCLPLRTIDLKELIYHA